MTILVTGGADFIGSHTCVELQQHGPDLVVLDHFSNDSRGALAAVRHLAPSGQLEAEEIDVRDREGLSRVFDEHNIDAVVHFAGKKAVNESLRIPVDDFDINLAGTISLLQCMIAHGGWRLVFSSSCSIHGDPYATPMCEDDPPAPVSTYARSRLFCEQILAAACARHEDLAVICLRYFNPAGARERVQYPRNGDLPADPSGLLPEARRCVPANVLPLMMQVAAGVRDKLQVCGTDYPTPDGGAVRNHIHVTDLAGAHMVAVGRLDDGPGLRALNVGTASGISVLELVRSSRKAAASSCHASSRRGGPGCRHRGGRRQPGSTRTEVGAPAATFTQCAGTPGASCSSTPAATSTDRTNSPSATTCRSKGA